MKALCLCLTIVSAVCSAQVAPLSKLWTADGFVEVCGRPDTAPSKEQLETMRTAPPSKFNDTLAKMASDRTAEVVMCLGFVSGLEQGWKEGHEHGVIAALFPEGWPKDEKKALSALPTKELDAGTAAMKVDVPCIPDYVTIGQKRDIIVKYIQEQEKKGNFLMPLALTSHVIWLAYQEAFQCPAQAPKQPDTPK